MNTLRPNRRGSPLDPLTPDAGASSPSPPAVAGSMVPSGTDSAGAAAPVSSEPIPVAVEGSGETAASNAASAPTARSQRASRSAGVGGTAGRRTLVMATPIAPDQVERDAGPLESKADAGGPAP